MANFLFILIFLFMLIFIVLRIHNLIKNKNYPTKYYSCIITFVFIIGLIIYCFIDYINSFIIFCHFLAILLFGNIIFLVIKKIFRKSFNFYLILIMSYCITAIYLSYGYYMAHHVIETYYKIETTKDLGVKSFRIVQITDSHISSIINGDNFTFYMEKINKTNPDIVVVTGDFVDNDTTLEDMRKACKGLGKLKTKYGVYLVWGNHDLEFNNDKDYDEFVLKKELKQNRVVLLEDDLVYLNQNIVLIGRLDAQFKNRLAASVLTQELDLNNYIITLDHEPNDYEAEASSGMDLVLSGHTHGGQLFPWTIISKFAFIDNNIYGMKKILNTNFIVSSGISNWRIKFKTGTKTEYVIIDLINKNY